MRRIKAIVYGVGAINNLATKYILEKGVDIVGAIDVDPRIVGKDLGEVAGLDHLNVKINDDADAVLSKQEADIAVVSIFSQMDRMYPHFKKCVENGLNVITPAEEALYPWEISPELAANLDKLAKKHGVTITGGGAQDSFRVNIMTLLTGASHTIESISIKQTGDMSQSGPEVIKNYHVGDTKDGFYRKMREKGIPLFSLKICLEALIADLGLTIKKAEQSAEPIVAEIDTPVESVVGGIVKKGLVLGMGKIIDFETEQGIKVHGEQIAKAFRRDEKAPTSLNECFIKGIPELYLKIQATDIEAKSHPIASLVNRIPDVINSEPGYVTIEKLPKLKFRAFPLQYYVKET